MTRPSVRDEVARSLGYRYREEFPESDTPNGVMLSLAEHIDRLYAATDGLLRFSQLMINALGIPNDVTTATDTGAEKGTST